MRSSMRPSSAGSSRISKRVLPLFAEAAISIASPLTGTGALSAAVAVSWVAAAGVVAAAVVCCAWIAPAAGTPLPEELTGAWPISAAARCALAWALAAVGAMELPDASAFTASTMPFSDFGFNAASVGAVTAGTMVSAAGVAGAAVSLVAACSTAVVVPFLARSGFLIWAAALVAAGVAATTAAACTMPVVMDGSPDVAWALTAWPTPPCAPVLALPSACAVAGWVTVVAASVVSAAAAAGAVSAASEAEAAIAAAAIASGAVALSVAGVAEAVVVGAAAAGMATAMAAAVTTAVSSGAVSV